MKVGFIGAGKVGTALGVHFQTHGIGLSGYLSRREVSAKEAACKTDSSIYTDLKDIVGQSDVILITTQDDSIGEVCRNLAEIPADWEARTVCHTSGVHSSRLLSGLSDKGAEVGSIHPMLSFADLEASVQALATARFTVEGSRTCMDIVASILARCGNTSVEISAGSKPLYHASACVLSNYLVTLVDMGLEMLGASGFEYGMANELAQQLIQSTLRNIGRSGAKNALTGPISRGDTETVRIHLEKLRQDNKSWLELYRALAAKTAELAEAGGKISPVTAEALKEVFSEYEQNNNDCIQKNEKQRQ